MVSVSFTAVNIDDGFFSPKINNICEKTIRRCLDKCYETGRIRNFAVAAKLEQGDHVGRFYNDSDVYKILEGVAYVLCLQPNSSLEAEADAIIDLIGSAQEADGYIQTYFQLKKPDEKWKDMNMHECYCIGHLIEAGIAYKHTTGKSKLYNIGKMAADLIYSLFGTGKEHWVPGHQEIELALIKLYHETGDVKYLNQSVFFLEERGCGFGKGYSWSRADWGSIYNQDHEKVSEMKDAKGHAVRALYMYCGIADAATLTDKKEYHITTQRLWDSIVKRNMYITGGVGSSKKNEGFTHDFDLPNAEAYCETCASIAMVYWNDRLNKMYCDSKYADIVELELYNGSLAGISLSADKFFYVNPLSSDGKHHRTAWFECSCCPTQISRFLPSIGNYIFSASNDSAVINQYISSTADVSLANGMLNLKVKARYPFFEDILITVTAEESITAKLMLRIPGWCENFDVCLSNGAVPEYTVLSGYCIIEKCWSGIDQIHLTLKMPVKICRDLPEVTANNGLVAIRRGPVIYCAEQTDNKDFDISIGSESKFIAEWQPELLGGIYTINSFYKDKKTTLIPYFAWDNREAGAMSVWLPWR